MSTTFYQCICDTVIRHERSGNLVVLIERFKVGEYITQRQYFDLPDNVQKNFIKLHTL